MPFDPVIAAIRFGCGLSPAVPPPASAAAMLAGLRGPDLAATAWPAATFATANPSLLDVVTVDRARNAARREGRAAALEALTAQRQQMNRDIALARAQAFAAGLARATTTADGFRERLVRFWADHFTVRARNGSTAHLVAAYVEEAIRPHVAATFPTLLRAAITHPMMVLYLEQDRSVGPNSRVGGGGRRGLNENLARELLELHTLGADGGYGQTDVRELAELLTGLTYSVEEGAFFRPAAAEPGTETVLGQSYGPAPAESEILRALDAIALRPETGRHIARKLATHFVADAPDAGLVAALAAAYQSSGGDLAVVYAALLDHPAAWQKPLAKVKQPIDFVSSALRALGVSGAALAGLDARAVRRFFQQPMLLMGQDWERPVGPDGWPEEAEAWVTPPGLAARFNWAFGVGRIAPIDLPDPSVFARVALGPFITPQILRAAKTAPSQAEGIGLVLSSAAFQRR